MRESILLLVLLAVVQVRAHASTREAKKKLDLSPPNEQSLTRKDADPGSATPLLFKDPRTQPTPNFEEKEKKGEVAVTTTCTDSLGMIYKQGDAGFSGCRRSENRAKPTDPPGARQQNTYGITIGR